MSYPFFVFAQRAFCAIEIRLRPAADILPRPVGLAPRFAPFSKASIRCSIFASSVFRCWYLLRSAFSNLVTKSTFSPGGVPKCSVTLAQATERCKPVLAKPTAYSLFQHRLVHSCPRYLPALRRSRCRFCLNVHRVEDHGLLTTLYGGGAD
jgi:hypothetical protein